jgi:hypothetical protein
MTSSNNICALDRGLLLSGAALAAVFLLSACVNLPPTSPGDDSRPVHMSLANRGAAPLHCRLIFGHWVDRDLDIIAPGGVVDFEILQAKWDGALYILRADGQRRMMIETIQCGREGGWIASFGQVDLAPARKGRPGRIETSCAEPANHGRVSCSTAVFDMQSGP